MAGPETAPMLPPRPGRVTDEQTPGINPTTGQPIRMHMVNGTPMMSRDELTRIEAAKPRDGATNQITPASRGVEDGNVIEHTVTNRVRLPDGMDPTIGGVLGAMMASPETAQMVARGIGAGLANLQAQQAAGAQAPPYYPAERVPTPTPASTENTVEQPHVRARVAGYPYGANGEQTRATAEGTEVPSGTRRAIGAVVTTGLLAAAVWFPVTATLSRFGKGDIKSQTPLSMEWSEVPDKFMAIIHNPGLVGVADRGDKK